MGTKQQKTEDLQKNIKEILNKLGWSYKEFADFIYCETHDIDTEDEVRKFGEKVKKELNRKTTKPEKLEKYLDILFTDKEVQKLDMVFNKYISQNYISPYLSEELKEISKEIDNALKNTTK